MRMMSHGLTAAYTLTTNAPGIVAFSACVHCRAVLRNAISLLKRRQCARALTGLKTELACVVETMQGAAEIVLCCRPRYLSLPALARRTESPS